MSSQRAPGRPPKRNINIKITEKNDKYLKFQLIGADTPYANAVRRIMMAEVETLAIDTVTILENTSPLFDEFLAHRMGMIPLRCTNLQHMSAHYACACTGQCGQCRRILKLDVTNNTNVPMNVTTDHLIHDVDENVRDTFPVHGAQLRRNVRNQLNQYGTANDSDDDNDDIMMSMGPDYTKKYNAIVIGKLAPGQTLRMRCTATKSIGKEHAKYIPAHVSMFPLPKITLNANILATRLSSEQRSAVAGACPTNSIGYNKNNDTVEIENALTCIQCQECVHTAESFGALDGVLIEEDENVFFYTIETFGQIEPIDVLIEGLRNLKTKIDNISQEVTQEQRKLHLQQSDPSAGYSSFD